MGPQGEERLCSAGEESFQALKNLEEEAVDPGTEINRRWERVASVYREKSEGCMGFRQRERRGKSGRELTHGKLSTAGTP